eukprot:4789317-Prymnesium_polylepis.4
MLAQPHSLSSPAEPAHQPAEVIGNHSPDGELAGGLVAAHHLLLGDNRLSPFQPIIPRPDLEDDAARWARLSEPPGVRRASARRLELAMCPIRNEPHHQVLARWRLHRVAKAKARKAAAREAAARKAAAKEAAAKEASTVPKQDAPPRDEVESASCWTSG